MSVKFGDVNNHADGFAQDCSNSIANALELQQSCTKPWIYWCPFCAEFHCTSFTKYPSKNTNKSCINISLQPPIILIWQVKLLIKQIQAQLKYNKLNTLSMGF